ncbi:MAG TPA: hypothetical protein VGP82_20305, partial [Ktedonobacterales bacterium]|nr:hypothetical protein [Ktedonobacterales bacterium]
MTTDPNETPRDPQYPSETPQNPETPQMPPTPQTPQAPPQYGSGPYIPQEPANPSGDGPYGAPPPPSGVYGTPPPAGPYGAPPAGAYAVPLGPPVPAGMGNIWQKWINVTTKPSVASFARELPTANWSDIWLSLIGLGILSAITGAIAALYTNQNISVPQANGTTTTVHIPAGAGLFSIIGVP